VGFNCTLPPFNEINARDAVAAAIDRESLILKIQGNSVLVANSILPENLLQVKPWSNLKFNLDRAQAFIRNSGPLLQRPIRLLCFHAIKERVAVYPLSIKQDLEKAGFKVEIVYYDNFHDYDQAVRQGNGHLFLDGWRSLVADADDFFSVLFLSADEYGKPNLFRFKNDQVDSLILLARRMHDDPKQRDAIYSELEVLLDEQMPCVPLNHRKFWYVLNTRVKSFRLNAIGIPHLELTQIDDKN